MYKQETHCFEQIYRRHFFTPYKVGLPEPLTVPSPPSAETVKIEPSANVTDLLASLLGEKPSVVSIEVEKGSNGSIKSME